MRNEHIVTIDQSKCTSCGLCQKVCPTHLFRMTDSGAEILSQNCAKCGHCVAVCPKNAVSMSGFADSPEEISPDMRVDANALLGQLKARRSMRCFKAQEIPPEILAQILRAGHCAPTASNTQGVSYIVLHKNIAAYEKIAVAFYRRLKKAADVFTSQFRNMELDEHAFFYGAPVAIVIKAKNLTYKKVDGALAASAMEQMALSLGVGTLYSGLFTLAVTLLPSLRKAMSVAPNETVVMTLVLGYPAVKYRRTAQRENQRVTYD